MWKVSLYHKVNEMANFFVLCSSTIKVLSSLILITAFFGLSFSLGFPTCCTGMEILIVEKLINPNF